jgi:hypothetical protein
MDMGKNGTKKYREIGADRLWMITFRQLMICQKKVMLTKPVWDVLALVMVDILYFI